MTYAEEQYRAHIERQKRLGKTVTRPARPQPVASPPLAPVGDRKQVLTFTPPLYEPVATLAQQQMIEQLQEEVLKLAAKLKALVREDQSPFIMPNRIKPVVMAVAKFYRVPLHDLVSFRRTRELARPRQVAMYLAKQITRHSLPAIARVFERDHTTVMHACRKIAAERLADPQLDSDLVTLTEQLTPPNLLLDGVPGHD
jgi:hypothetical protein